MPNSWYHVSKYNNNNNSVNNKKKIKEQFTVLKADFVDSYHYHGSWFEYTWDLLLESNDGLHINKKLDTWDKDRNLVGKTIEKDGSFFEVV